MAKSNLNGTPTSAVASELLDAARSCVAPPTSPSEETAAITKRGTVRREFTILPELDELLGYTIVPAMRRVTGLPVNRSTVVRAMLMTLVEVWRANSQSWDTLDFSTKDPDEAASLLLIELFQAAAASTRGQQKFE